MASAPLPLAAAPIHFGTDGWRGVIGVDITIERLLTVAAAAAQELAYRAPTELKSRKVIIGYDRRFLAPEMAEAIAAAVRGCELEPLLTETPVPTPACSWAVVQHQALGALVITASHNPPEWLGLKIKGPFGGSVEGDFTAAVEQRLTAGGITVPIDKGTERFDCRREHLEGLRSKLDLETLKDGLKTIGLKVIVDPMHGSAAGCISELLAQDNEDFVQEIRSQRDPLFGGHPPEPLAPYLQELIAAVRASSDAGQDAVGLVFDGDGDRIAAVDEAGNFCSTQLLMPLLIDHLARARQLPGKVVKTVSGSDLMRLVAEDLGREVLELPVGFKYIAAEMLTGDVLIGGEESGGVGFGMHLPERDALFAALLVLEALVEGGQPLGARMKALQQRCGGVSFYERFDLRLADMDSRQRLETLLEQTPPATVADQPVQDVIRTDGVKFRLGPSHWLMLRFSGTEPLLRIYCEAPSKADVKAALNWAKQLAERT
ncbi:MULTISPECIES: phosphoglucomutase/phosphomannomutase family protein [unclassified Prochlorococcus]|uniref:phosphoglucomutase/phosphomannomutase family protein n=1 Tax=unclassified Prochlorococcus TaxID=2627481 RepID=UPI0005336FD0|nr:MULTISPECIES: phosphoglucomutase/phosphomannomutase family protein [unclassified Prochlorococcus]KGG26599.1 Phosphoglucosamine mutase [Prochlorococcus sp. MIT 0701]KGG30154.1 Phosphoglucosamine mutase [Prochlorococcus sp. MIT 0702]KGG33191.1 Phosphoglucosamine mutase [Prochlorococcus sp. MIT 0703]